MISVFGNMSEQQRAKWLALDPENYFAHVRLEKQIAEYLARPKPEKPKHRTNNYAMYCTDCGRTAVEIALDEWRPCVALASPEAAGEGRE